MYINISLIGKFIKFGKLSAKFLEIFFQSHALPSVLTRLTSFKYVKWRNTQTHTSLNQGEGVGALTKNATESITLYQG